MASRSSNFDVLVVGAGPAGIAAACCAAESGASVGLLDNNPRAGGQIWRGHQRNDANPDARKWFDKFAAAKIEFLPSTEVIDQLENGRLIVQSIDAQSIDEVRELTYKNLILCTGARELFLPFPGWTLPNVMGAGGLQALVKGGLSINGKKVVVAGSGPLLLAVAAHLREHGADVRLIAEQAPWHRLARFGMSLAFEKTKLAQAFAIKRQLSGVPYKTNCWPLRANGAEKLESVTLRSGDRTWQEPCDYLACGFHLVPNTELAALLGCELRAGFIRIDENQRSSIANIFAAGELTSIGGVDLSILEGQIAGYVASGQAASAAQLAPQKRRLDRFAALLRETFALRDELRSLADPETIICRCEDVTLSRIRHHSSWRASKLHTRCGMG
ncbi:MAG TPA: FAD-dependent oxidoreductase, partial [Candidatus Acidoferrales bacterium]|nr:FAD-dependent oxidoreductase [Candidatus Acidoferrales bacterium]